MRGTVAKELRDMFNIREQGDNPIVRKVYRRTKKKYNSLPKKVRPYFLAELRERLNGE